MMPHTLAAIVICCAAMPAAAEPPEAVVQRISESIDAARLRATVDRLAAFGTRHTLSDTESETRGIGAARRWVKSEMEACGGRLEVSLDSHVVEGAGGRLPEGAEVVNVVAVLPGTMREAAEQGGRSRRYYVVGHLDSRNSDGADAEGNAPGANDDGSGVALLMELARALADEPLEATVVFMATSGEEQGLYGARLHAKAQAGAGADIRAVLNNDTVGDPSGVGGRDARHEIRVFSEGLDYSLLQPIEGEDPDRARVAALKRLRLYGMESDGGSRQLARFIAEVAERHDTTVKPRLIFRPDRFLRGGDHTPFNELGIPAVRFCEVHENYDHQHQDVRVEDGVQYGDLPEYVDEEYLADVTRLNAAVLIHLANAPSVPGNARIITASLANDTTLRWGASPEPDVAGYEVVWRETTSPVWTESRDVGAVNEATIDLSKDNWFFGVRAYDKDGYRSPVAFPIAAGE